jgi:hypothetical protein
VGEPFPISQDADAREPGAIGFEGNNYLILWESNDGTTNAISSIHGQFVSAAGTPLGNRINFSDDSECQKFPALAFDGVNYLVGWTAPAAGTNAWQVKGCFLSTSGVLQPPMVLSQAPAMAAHPIALAFGHTNYLMVWSRELGP